MIDSSKLKKIQDCKGRIKEIIGDDGVLQLAKDGVCPHYIITNPLTKEESIWFVPSEINEWFERNYINYREGNFVTKYSFVYFNKDIHKASGKVPDELIKIKNLYHLPIEYISTPPGIYFLCKNNKIRYIGQASNISNRVITHISEGVKDFDSIYFITCPINRLTEIESALIRYLQPDLNLSCKVAPSRKDTLLAESLLS